LFPDPVSTDDRRVEDPPIARWSRQGVLLEAIRITESIRNDGQGFEDFHRRLGRLTDEQRRQLAETLERLLRANER
jgi:hypothetical protein